MTLNILKYKAYGHPNVRNKNRFKHRSFAAFEDTTITPDISKLIQTPIPVTDKPSPKQKSFQPHLIPGCRADPGSGGFKYSKNGKSATGSTCEIAKLNYDIKFPPFLGTIQDDHRDIERIERTFKGMVRCSDPRKRGCFRVVVGRDEDEARRNFCSLFGINGRCEGDPSFVMQNPPFVNFIDRRYVILAADDDIPDAKPVAQAQQEAQSQSITINNAPPPALDPKASTAGAGLDNILSGNIGGVSTPLVLGGGLMLLLLVMAMRK